MNHPRTIFIVLAILTLQLNHQSASAQFSWDGECSTLWYDCCIIGENFENNWATEGNPSGCPPLPGPADTVSLSGLVDSGGAQINIAGMFQSGVFLCWSQGLSILDGDIFTAGSPPEPSLFQLNGTINLNDGATFNVGSFSTLDFQSGQIQASGTPGQKLVIGGFGTLTKTAQPAANTRLSGVPFDNHGLISVPVGTLIVDAGGSSSGTIEVLDDGVLYFEGGTFDLAGEVRGDGLMHFHNGAANIIGNAGNYHPINTLIGGYPAVVNFETAASVENLTLTSSGTIGGAAELTIDDFTWLGASIILPGGIISIEDTASLQGIAGQMQLQRDMELRGASKLFNGATLALHNAEIRNFDELDLQGNSNITHQTCCVPNSNLKNFGTLRKTGGGTSLINVGLSNVGMAFEVQSGTLILDGQMASTGPITVDAGATLQMRNNQQSLFPEASITGAGTVMFNGGLDYLEGTYDVATTEIWEGGAVQFQNDATTTTLNMVNGTLTGDGTFTVTGALNFAWGGSVMSGGGVTRALGPVTMTYSGYLHRTLEIDNAKSSFGDGPPAGGMLNIPGNSGGELRGIGSLDGNVSDFAGIAPGLPANGQPIGSLSITGNFTQYSSPPGQLNIDINGAAHDQFIVGGTATLSGHLTVTGTPLPGAAYTILTAQNIIGTFAQVSAPAGIQVIYTATSVILHSAPGTPCPADIFPVGLGNGDGVVGPGDLGQLLSKWGPCASPCSADLFPTGAPDGIVGPGDLGQLLSQWGPCR